MPILRSLIVAISIMLIGWQGTVQGKLEKIVVVPSLEKADSLVPKNNFSNSPRVAFTFDDGPHPFYTQKILEILRDNQIPATFFLVGKQVAKYPELTWQIAIEEHEVANHSYHHPNVSRLTKQELKKEIRKTELLIESITHKKLHFFRPPGGNYNSAVIKTVEDMGYTMALWSVLPGDHKHPPASAIENRVLSKIQYEAIVLLHSGVDSTLQALPNLIHELKERGYKFVTLSQLYPHHKNKKLFIPTYKKI